MILVAPPLNFMDSENPLIILLSAEFPQFITNKKERSGKGKEHNRLLW